MRDVVERFWNIIEDISINKLLLFLKDNIVGTVVLATALIWIPASLAINFIDSKRREERRLFDEECTYASDASRVVYSRGPYQRGRLHSDVRQVIHE